MKRIAALGVLVATCWPLAGAAHADKPSSKKVGQSRDEVVEYWTASRMRDAKPVEKRRIDFAKGGGKSSSGTAREVPPPYETFPTSTNGKVFFTDNGVNYVCSGTALASANESVVWTAGHCVNEGPGDYFTNWMFVPAYRDGLQPLGKWTARELLTTPGWQQGGDFSFDLGAAKVSPDASGTTLTRALTGGRVPAFNYTRSQRYNAYGYPAASPFNGQRLWMCDSTVTRTDTSANPATMGIACNMTGGSSGGGWLVPADGNRLYSVNSYGYSSIRNTMFGPYQGAVAQDLYTAAQSG